MYFKISVCLRGEGNKKEQILNTDITAKIHKKSRDIVSLNTAKYCVRKYNS